MLAMRVHSLGIRITTHSLLPERGAGGVTEITCSCIIVIILHTCITQIHTFGEICVVNADDGKPSAVHGLISDTLVIGGISEPRGHGQRYLL